MSDTAQLRAPAVPIVDFYGDVTEWSTSALIHSEPLIERSSLHEWRIGPHRHSSLTQLFLLLEGGGSARLDGERFDFSAPCVVVVPELSVHEFEWHRHSGGFALSIASTLKGELDRQIGVHLGAFDGTAVVDATADREYIGTLFAAIDDECREQRPMKEISLDALIRALAVWLGRNTAPTSATADHGNRANRHYSRFVDLVDLHHKEQWSVSDYAGEIGITASHLNAICRKLGGSSALQLIHDRLLLAARRDLVYTDKSIAGVAVSLGFAEPSYFTRFFKRHMGITPKAYRRRSGTLSG